MPAEMSAMPSPAVTTSAAAASQHIEPVKKSIRVRSSVAHAFRTFTEGMDSWWPRTHHIGKSPMQRVVVEPFVGGAIYTDEEDGTACPWASVLVWDPPHRFVMAWQVTPEWQYEPDLSKCSEVELLFTPADDGTTLVELEHRALQRHGAGGANMRDQVNAEGGWATILQVYAEKAEGTSSESDGAIA